MPSQRHKRLARSIMSPLKIIARLQTPVMGDLTLPMDSILHYLVHREAYGRQDFTTPGAVTEVDGSKDTSLPLARVDEHGPMWFYAASFAQWGKNYVDGGDHWSRRFAMGRTKYLDTAKTSVDVASGRYKSYRMPIFYRHALEITWYAIGERRRIASLLSHMNHIGKKTSQGWGAVNEWLVEETDQNYSVTGPSGELMRSVPAEGGILAGFRPSYWYSKNQAPCRMPEES